MDEQAELTKYRRLIESIAIGKAKSLHLHTNDDDVKAEAMAAALKAVRTYRSQSRAKLSTHITSCVLNKIRDLKKHESRRLVDLEELEDEQHPDTGDYFVDTVDTVIDIEQALTEFEKEIVERLLDGYKKIDIIESIRGGDSFATAKGKLNLCLSRIQRKLSSLDLSQLS
jgi:DNA-directed RNA polymerase specialized sigma24 family protein